MLTVERYREWRKTGRPLADPGAGQRPVVYDAAWRLLIQLASSPACKPSGSCHAPGVSPT